MPKHLVKGYDGDTLWFNITEDEAEDTFKKDRPPKEREYSRYKSASVTEQYDNVSLSNTTITEVSQTNGYNIEERLPLLEKKDTIKNTTTGTGDSSAKSGIEDWDSIIHKGVRTKDMQPVGNVTAVTDTSIVITSEGARDEYSVPKEEVEVFNGAEVMLNATIDRFEQFRVKVAR